jgi:uncharacterized protein (DUF2141 family)
MTESLQFGKRWMQLFTELLQFSNLKLNALGVFLKFGLLNRSIMLKGNLLITIFLIAVTVGVGQTKLEVTVQKIKEHTGTIRVGLFNNEKDFLEKAVSGKIVKADADQVTVAFEDLKPGEYAVSVIHDENENGKLDSNGFGIPKEGFGFSNNAMGMFGPPSFDKAKIIVKEKSTKHVLDLKYF